MLNQSKFFCVRPSVKKGDDRVNDTVASFGFYEIEQVLQSGIGENYVLNVKTSNLYKA